MGGRRLEWVPGVACTSSCLPPDSFLPLPLTACMLLPPPPPPTHRHRFLVPGIPRPSRPLEEEGKGPHPSQAPPQLLPPFPCPLQHLLPQHQHQRFIKAEAQQSVCSTSLNVHLPNEKFSGKRREFKCSGGCGGTGSGRKVKKRELTLILLSLPTFIEHLPY